MGGGYSTDTGPLGLLELTNVNFRNRLEQTSAANSHEPTAAIGTVGVPRPAFLSVSPSATMPAGSLSPVFVDSSITRFFRSTIDQGTNGIVQRLDENGNPVDRFGQPAGEPTINRSSSRWKRSA
jgi:hypothetical protein